MRVEVHADPSSFAQLADEWDDLAARCAHVPPYLTRPWARSWWEVLGRRPRALPARPHLLAVRRDGSLVGLHPLLAVGARRGRPHRLLVGAGQEHADEGGALVEDAEAADALAEHLVAEVRTGRTVVDLTRLRDDDPVLAALRARAEAAPVELRCEGTEEYPYLDLASASDPAALVHRLQRRNDVHRRFRRLAEVGDVTWVGHHPDAAGEGLAAFFELHDRRWAGRRATGPFAAPAGRRFLAEAAAGLDRAGMLRLSLLLLDGRPIGARFGVVTGGRYLGMKSAWDPDLAPYGPGHLLVGRVLDDAVAEGWREIDFLRGAAPHKAAWADRSRSLSYWVLGRAGRLGALDRRLMWAALRVRNRARQRSAG